MDGGLNFSNAAGQMRPPLFWKSKPKFESAMDRWTEEKLHAARSRLLDAFVDVRTTGRPENETRKTTFCVGQPQSIPLTARRGGVATTVGSLVCFERSFALIPPQAKARTSG